MAVQSLDAKLIAKMFLAGANNLNAKKEWINELNVFPVPDGDTGTNMTLTILSAAKEVTNLGDSVNMASLCKAISSGSLRGARGNSGVILSQLLRGFTKVIREHEEVDSKVLALAFNKAVETAYKAVMKPKEGTILTVARGAAERASELSDKIQDLDTFLDKVIEHAEYVLKQTPEMLPVLKQAGVVDSGGQGLVEVLKGANDALHGKEVDFTLLVTPSVSKAKAAGGAVMEEADIKFGYCTEFIIMLDKIFNAKNELDFKGYLESIGDSIVCVADDDVVKVHVHTNDPGLAIQRGLKYGQLTSMKIDNMREEHHERVIKSAQADAGEETPKEEKEETTEQPASSERKAYGFISVSAGEGLDEIFKGLGVDYIIAGGQTMNPSTEDMLNAIEKVNADTVYILPNNKNIILAANQAQALTEDKNIVVIPTKTVPQGITALITFVPDASAEENEEAMTAEIAKVKTGQVTYAVRDTVIDDKEIKQGNIMGIGDKTILSVGTTVEDTAKDMLRQMVDSDSELISIYYGNEVGEEIAAKFGEDVGKEYGDIDVEIHSGGQPIYYYIISVE